MLLDRDHQIGHSYFIGKNADDLEDIFFDSVIPLLNEYFYGDWEKLRAILGKAEETDEKNRKITSFIKEIKKPKFAPGGNNDCDVNALFDFVKKDEIDFDKALENANLYTKSDTNTNNENQESAEIDTNEDDQD